MRILLQIISGIALLATIAAPILFLFTHLTLDQTKWSMLASTIVWFAVTPFWMGRQEMDEELVI
jgi:uncharacterized membrane protein